MSKLSAIGVIYSCKNLHNQADYNNMLHKLKTIGISLALLCSSAHAAPDLAGFNIKFADEFNGSTLDNTLWNTSPIWGPFTVINEEEQYYVDVLKTDQGFSWSPFQLSGGILTIRAAPVSDASVPAAPNQPAESAAFWDSNTEYQFNTSYSASTRNYLSGIITSSDTFNFTHGYAEIKAKLPSGQGLWPAFWQLTTKYVEDVPEIDIVESIGQFPNEVYHTYHYFNIDNNWELVSTPTYKTVGPDFTDGYHTYGMLWEPKKLTWYVDGEAVKTLTEADGFLIPKQAMYLIANLAVGGTWPGSPDETTPDNAELNIDYIRLYQKELPTPVTPAILTSDYQLMFEDNFNGTSIDTNKWNSAFLWGPYLQINNEEQIYIDKLGRHRTEATNPFVVSDGTLKIVAKAILQSELPTQEPETDPIWSNTYPTHQYNSNYNTTGGWVPSYSSGILTTYDAFKFVSGYVEMRAKLPEGDGLWPAFWLLNGYYVGPQPELDILETKGEEPNIAHHSYHYTNSVGNLVSDVGTFTKPTGDYSSDFHTYAVEWNRDYIKWYIDGQVTRQIANSQISKQLMYVLINLAVGGNFVGQVDPNVLPTQFEIDYVRAYQLKNNDSQSPVQANTIVLPNKEWRLISIPFDTPQGQNTAAQMFADDISGTYTEDWILFGYDTLGGRYFDPGLNGELVLGGAYWVSQITGSSVTLDIPQANTVEDSESQLGCATVKCFAFTPSTSSGVQWHLAGNPFTGNTKVSDIRVVATGTCELGCTLQQASDENLIHIELFTYDGTVYEEESNPDEIDGWEGFWFATLPSAAAKNATVLISQ